MDDPEFYVELKKDRIRVPCVKSTLEISHDPEDNNPRLYCHNKYSNKSIDIGLIYTEALGMNEIKTIDLELPRRKEIINDENEIIKTVTMVVFKGDDRIEIILNFKTYNKRNSKHSFDYHIISPTSNKVDYVPEEKREPSKSDSKKFWVKRNS